MHYGLPPESYWVESYFQYTDQQIEEQIAEFTKIFGDLKGKTFLDIGAGIGKYMVALNKGGAIAYGIEPSQPFYDRAVGRMNIDPAQLRLSSVEDAELRKICLMRSATVRYWSMYMIRVSHSKNN